MGILESIKTLETKIDKEIDLAKQLMEENGQLRETVALYQKRIEDQEALINAYREEQHAIESGILSALNRLNQFEDAVEKKLIPVSASSEVGEPVNVEEPVEEDVSAEPKPQIDGEEEVPAMDSEPEANFDQPKSAQ